MGATAEVVFEVDTVLFNRNLIETIVKAVYNPQFNERPFSDKVDSVYNDGKGGSTSIGTAPHSDISIWCILPDNEEYPHLKRNAFYIMIPKDLAELEDPDGYSQFIKDVHAVYSSLPDATGLFGYDETIDLENYPDVNPENADFTSKIYSGTVFLSKTMVKKIGKEKLSSAPAKKVVFFDNGGAYLQTDDDPFGASKERREKITKYLHEN